MLLCACALGAQELLLPVREAPPEHNSARFSELVETDVVGIPSVDEAHGERMPSHAGASSAPAHELAARGSASSARPSRSPAPAEAPVFSFPVTLGSFQGLGDSGTSIPPDTMGAVGPRHVMVTLNTQVQIEDRQGNVLVTRSLGSFWTPLGSFTNIFDPRIFYDPYGKRWVTAALANSNSNNSAILVAASVSDDPTGSWTYYKFSGDPNPSGPKQYWADYTNLGFNKNWIVVSVNLIPFGSSSTNDARILAISKADAYAGAANPLAAPFLVNNSNTLVPAYTYDPGLETMYVAEEWDNNTGQLRLSTITGPVGSESFNGGTAFVSSGSSWAPSPDTSNFAPQKGDTRLISAGDSRLQNLIYRNGDLWASQTSFLPFISPDHSLLQWWQTSTGGTLKQFVRIEDVTKQNFYAYPGLAVNKDGCVLVGYTKFSSSIYPSAAYSLQSPGTVNQMTTAPAIFKAGLGSYFKDFSLGENRWGDYSLANVDPVDDTDLWTLAEYAAGSSQFGVWWLHLWPGDGTVAAKPSSYDFGTQQLQATASKQFTIVNGSPSGVGVTGVGLSGTGAASYSQTNDCPPSLDSGAFCTVIVNFKPMTPGAAPATLTIGSTGTPATLPIALAGTGQANGPPDSLPGLTLSWATPVVLQTSWLTGDSSDPLPPCQGNLTSAQTRANTGWFLYQPESTGAIGYSATSLNDFAVSVWTAGRRGFHQEACTRAQPVGGVYTVSNSNLPVASTQTYYFMISVAPGDTATVTLSLPAAGAPAALTAINTGTKFFPPDYGGTASQVVAVANNTTTAQPFGISSGNPSFGIQFANSAQCSPSVPASAVCIATVTYTPSGTQPAIPHALGTLSMSGNVSPVSASVQALLPTDLTPYSAAYGRTINSLPFSDSKAVPAIAVSDNSGCAALSAPLFYFFSPSATGSVHVNPANYVVKVSGSDSSSVCYTQFGAGSDQGFLATAGVQYTIEIGTDKNAVLPSTEAITLSGTGSVFALSPSPVFFGRFPFGGSSPPVTMTLSNGSDNPMPVTFSGAPFVVSNSTCGSSLAPTSSCTFQLRMSAPPSPGGSLPYTTAFVAGNTRAAVSWISPPMTLLSSATAVHFFSIPVGDRSATKSLVLTMQDNIGPVQVQSAGDFQQRNDCDQASYLRPYCTVYITFAPTVTGVAVGSLTINYNLDPPSGSQDVLVVPLDGTALPSTVIRPVRPSVTSGSSVSQQTSAASASKTAPAKINEPSRKPRANARPGHGVD
jgi:hypothetical protein